MKNCKVKFLNDGFITIEASLATFIFIIGYLIVNSIIINISVQSDIRKSLNSTIKDLALYVQVADKMGYLDNIKTKEFSKDQYIELIKEEYKRDSDILGKLKDLFISDVKNFTKSYLSKEITKKILDANIENINSNIDKSGITGGISGIRVEKASILEDGENIEIVIGYKWKSGLLGYFEKETEVIQKACIKPWIHGIKNNLANSIWKDTAFKRGNYFARKIKGESNLEIIKSGKGIDLYNREKNQIIQIYSINVFDDSYSVNSEGKYILKDNFEKKIKAYKNKIKKNIEKYRDKIVLENGESLEINDPELKLIIVLPLEANELEHVKQLENKLNKNGVELEFYYMEKLFNE